MRYGFPSLTNVRARSDYVISYDTRNRVPYWVCEHLTADRVAKNPEVDRAKSDFHVDPSIHAYFRSAPLFVYYRCLKITSGRDLN